MAERKGSGAVNIELCVFDMAGTTIDDRGLVYDALRDCVQETGATVAVADLQAWMGTEKSEAIANLIRLGGGTPTDELVAKTFQRFLELLTGYYEQTPPVPLEGVEDALASLRSQGVKVALTTGFSRDIADPLLASLGWSVGSNLDAVVTADEVAAGRPAPYMIHRALERAGVRDMRAVLVAGDTVADVIAGLSSGAAVTVGVLTGALSRDDLAGAGATHVLDGVKDVPALLEGIR